jgi:AraC family transcriptional regulator
MAMTESMLFVPGDAGLQDYGASAFEASLITDAPVPAVPPPHKSERPRARPHLAPWQLKVACQMMVEQMSAGVTLVQVADRLGMSVSHFIKAFGQTRGISPYQWYSQRRIARAITLLAQDAVPLSKISDSCGFADQSHFTKAFTRLLGISPGRWRRAVRSGGLEQAVALLAPDKHAVLTKILPTCGND